MHGVAVAMLWLYVGKSCTQEGVEALCERMEWTKSPSFTWEEFENVVACLDAGREREVAAIIRGFDSVYIDKSLRKKK